MARDWTNLRPASFGGVRFHVMEERPEVGRRVAVHEVSASERVITEDMGRRAASFFLDAYVAGDLADAAGLALEAVCTARGPNLLMLPVGAPRSVHCLACQRRRHKDKNGLMAYRLEFVEAGSAGLGFATGLSILKGIFDRGAAAAASDLSP